VTKITCPVCDGEPNNYVPDDDDLDHWRNLDEEDQVRFYWCEDCNDYHVECLICEGEGFLYTTEEE
jgi:hypothetical protein